MLRRLLLVCALISQAGAFSVSATLPAAIAAHGGLAKWRSFGRVEYDCLFKNAKGTKNDHQLFNLHTRDGVIVADGYTLGALQGEVWIKPGLDALGGTPPRFYIWTPFYFFAMPFVFGDPGVLTEALDRKSFQDRAYDVVKVSFAAGTGDSPEDYYLAYLDPETHRLKLAVYVVTYAPLRKGKPLAQLSPHAIVFEEWQQADGLTVPKTARYFDWKNETVIGEPLGELSFGNVRFAVEPPDAAVFARPAEAVIAPKP